MYRLLPVVGLPWPIRYGLAIAIVLVAFVVKLFIADLHGNSPVMGGVFVIFSSAVALSAVYGGFGPGVLATVLSVVIGDIWFLPPYGLLVLTSGGTALHSALFVFDGLFFSVLSGALRAAQRKLMHEVDARTQAERLAATQRDQLQITLASIGDGVIVTDAQGTVTFLNGVAETLTGWPTADATGKPIEHVFNIVNEYTRVLVETPTAEVLRKGIVVGLANHTLLIARDGTERPIADSGAPIRDNGTIHGTVLVFRDVSDDRTAARALEERERNYRLLVEQASEAIWVTDSQGRITMINAVGGALFGYTPEALIGTALIDLLPVGAETYGFTEARQNDTVAWQRTMRRKDGTLIVVEGSSHMLSDGRFQAIVRDRTAQQAAERTERFLAQATLTLTSFLDYSKTLSALANLVVPALADYSVVDVIEADGTIRRVAVAHDNPAHAAAAQQLMTYAPMYDQLVGIGRVLHTGEPALVPEISHAYLEQIGHDATMVELIESIRPYSLITVPLAVRGRMLGALSLVTTEGSQRRYTTRDLQVAMDLAQRAALAVDNAQLYREVQATLRERDQFLSVAAHELRTPLTALSASAQLLLRRAARANTMEERDLQAVQRISNQAERLNMLIESLLNLSRIELGQLPLNRKRLDLVAFIQRVIEEYQLTWDQRPIQLVLPETALHVLGDDVRLEQVVQNLIQNAVKYSPAGGDITVTVQQQDQYAVVQVQDHGIGIPEAAQARLFQRFYRAGNVSHQRISGFGIGLYVVKDIVDRHEGEVRVASEEGHGSTFTVMLPLVHVAQDAAEQLVTD